MYVYTRYTECYERNELLEIIFSAKNKKRMVSEKISNDIDRFDRFFFLYKEKAKIILTRLPGKKRRVIIYLGVREI